MMAAHELYVCQLSHASFLGLEEFGEQVHLQQPCTHQQRSLRDAPVHDGGVEALAVVSVRALPLLLVVLLLPVSVSPYRPACAPPPRWPTGARPWRCSNSPLPVSPKSIVS